MGKHKIDMNRYRTLDDLNDAELDDIEYEEIRLKQKRQEAAVRRAALAEAREERKAQRIERETEVTIARMEEDEPYRERILRSVYHSEDREW